MIDAVSAAMPSNPISPTQTATEVLKPSAQSSQIDPIAAHGTAWHNEGVFSPALAEALAGWEKQLPRFPSNAQLYLLLGKYLERYRGRYYAIQQRDGPVRLDFMKESGLRGLLSDTDLTSLRRKIMLRPAMTPMQLAGRFSRAVGRWLRSGRIDP